MEGPKPVAHQHFKMAIMLSGPWGYNRNLESKHARYKKEKVAYEKCNVFLERAKKLQKTGTKRGTLRCVTLWLLPFPTFFILWFKLFVVISLFLFWL